MADCTYRGHRCFILAPGLVLRLEGEGSPCIERPSPDGSGPLSLPVTAEQSAKLQGRLGGEPDYISVLHEVTLDEEQQEVLLTAAILMSMGALNLPLLCRLGGRSAPRGDGE